jgi:hypothetical protein
MSFVALETSFEALKKKILRQYKWIFGIINRFFRLVLWVFRQVRWVFWQVLMGLAMGLAKPTLGSSQTPSMGLAKPTMWVCPDPGVGLACVG